MKPHLYKKHGGWYCVYAGLMEFHYTPKSVYEKMMRRIEDERRNKTV